MLCLIEHARSGKEIKANGSSQPVRLRNTQGNQGYVLKQIQTALSLKQPIDPESLSSADKQGFAYRLQGLFNSI